MDQSKLTRTVEIDGRTFEIDLKAIKEVHTYKVGDRVKVLRKDYANSYSTHPGCIIAIDMFKALPTIVVAYMPTGAFSSDAEIKFEYLNAQNKNVEIAPMVEDEFVPTRQMFVAAFERAIQKHHADIADLETKREWFLRRFGVTFGVAAEEMAAATSST